MVSPATLIAFPPYKSDVSALIKPGINKIDIRVVGSLKNLLGPHHNNSDPGLASPGYMEECKRLSCRKKLPDAGLWGCLRTLVF